MAANSTKTNATNTFEGGLVTDIHPLRVDNKSLVYAKNVDFVAAGSGSQLILQKRDGTSRVIDPKTNQEVTLSSGFEPVAVAELDNILYIVSYNSATSVGEIGTFPSPMYQQSYTGIVPLESNYKPLNNFHDGSGSYEKENFNSPFTTPYLYFREGGFVDIRLSKSYDSSVNIILTDDISPIRLINTRFAVQEDGKNVELISHRSGNGTNSYSEQYFTQTELIPTTVSIPKLTFNGLTDGGNLEAGGYRYFFRYVKDDGAQTDIIEESRLVSVHQGNSDVTSYGLAQTNKTTKSASFTLENLDDSYYGIKVYYTLAGGDADAVTTSSVIDTIYKINDGKCQIVHTGFEPTLNYNKDELTLKYSTISNSKTLTISNDRLIVANTEDYFTTNDILESLASGLQIEEGTFDVYHDNTGSLSGLSADKSALNYANANFTYNNLGYWKGETYELGIVFISDKGLSAVYPLQGMDRLADTFGGSLTAYPTLPTDGSIFGTNGVNTKGVYRTAGNGQLWSISGSDIIFKGTKLKLDVSSLLQEVPAGSAVSGYVVSNQATVGGTPAGWWVYYNTETNTYYLRGTVTSENFSNTTPRIDLTQTPGIPIPLYSIKFGAIEITNTGMVYNRGVANGTNLTKLYGPPVDARSASNGFFIVRRKRIKDKMLEGVVVPVGAYPTETKGDKDEGQSVEFGYPGNWIGCGVNSIKKDNVVMAPAPSLCAAFGNTTMSTPSDTLVLANFYDTNKLPVEVTTTVLIDPTLPRYTGVPTEEKTVDIPLSYVRTDITNISFDRISIANAYVTTGIPCTVNTSNNTVTIKISHLASSVDKIVKGTKVFIQQSVTKLPGQTGTADIIVRAPICDYDSLKSWAFYSPDVECAPELHASLLHDNFNLTFPQTNIEGEVQSLTNPDAYNALLPYYTKLTGTFSLSTSSTKRYTGRVDYVGDGSISTGTKSFTALLDRVLYVWHYRWAVGDSRITKARHDLCIKGDDDPDNVQGVSVTNVFIDDIFTDGVSSNLQRHQYWDGGGHRFGNGIKYGRYAGIRIDDYTAGDLPLTNLNTVHPIISGAIARDNAYRTNNYFHSIKGFTSNFNDTSKFGAYCQISNTVLTYDGWKQVYNKDTDTEYFAISRRYAYTEFDNGLSSTIDLYGGDCYVGLSWKQVWYPKGIEEAPQATDLKAYELGNRNMGMLNYGYVIPIPAQSNYNFNIRSKDKSNEQEFRALGKERSFIPIRPLASSRGNRVFDTGKYNKGYVAQDISDNKLFKLSDSAPYYKEAYPNRIYASESFQENNFVNGFTIFKGFNFKDYNSELGPICRLITLSDKLYAIFRDGIGIIGVTERTQVSTDTGGVYIDNADVLAQKATIISTGYGSSKPNSIVSTNNYVYGVDMNRAKIWRTNGGAPELISDTRIQTILAEILEDINAMSIDSWNDIYATFDPFKGDVSFTFMGKDRSNPDSYVMRTLVFNELPQLNCWICETDDNRKFFNSSNNIRYSFTPNIGKEHILYKYDNNVTIGGNNIFYDVQRDGVVRYSVVDDTGSSKVFENIWLAGDNPLPFQVKYLSDKTYDNGAWISQTLRPYTNVAYYAKRLVAGEYIQCTGTIQQGTKLLTVSGIPTMTPPGRSEALIPGDYISIEKSDGTFVRFVIISINNNNIYVDTQATETITDGKLIFGYKTPIWMTDSSIEDGYGKIVCLSGTDFKTKPRGKWMQFEMVFTGEDQIYIGAIVTSYSKSFS